MMRKLRPASNDPGADPVARRPEIVLNLGRHLSGTDDGAAGGDGAAPRGKAPDRAGTGVATLIGAIPRLEVLS